VIGSGFGESLGVGARGEGFTAVSGSGC